MRLNWKHIVNNNDIAGTPVLLRLRDVNANGAVTYSNTVYAEFREPKGFIAGNVYPSHQDLFALEFMRWQKRALICGFLILQVG